MKPIVKWSGGKTKEIPLFEKWYPENFDVYIEPFVGGGAVFFDGDNWQQYGRKEGLSVLEINPHALLPYQEGVLTGTLGGGAYYLRQGQAVPLRGDYPDKNVTALMVLGRDIYLGTGTGLVKVKGEAIR